MRLQGLLIESRYPGNAPLDSTGGKLLIRCVPQSGKGSTQAELRFDVNIEIPNHRIRIGQYETTINFVLIVSSPCKPQEPGKRLLAGGRQANKALVKAGLYNRIWSGKGFDNWVLPVNFQNPVIFRWPTNWHEWVGDGLRDQVVSNQEATPAANRLHGSPQQIKRPVGKTEAGYGRLQ